MPNPDSTALFCAALQVSLPTFAWVVLGLVLRRLGLLSQALVSTVSRLAFNFVLPVMLVCIGGSMQLSKLRSTGPIIWEASIWRLCIGPARLSRAISLNARESGAPLSARGWSVPPVPA